MRGSALIPRHTGSVEDAFVQAIVLTLRSRSLFVASSSFIGRMEDVVMHTKLLPAALALMLFGAVTATAQQEKSKQNAADESEVKGDLGSAKDADDPKKIEESAKKLEQAAEDAKRKSDGKAPASPASPFTQLSDEQRRTIYQSIKTDAQSSGTANVGSVQVGASLPPSVELRMLPSDVVQRIGGANAYRYVLADGKVLLVEPSARVVVAVLSE